MTVDVIDYPIVTEKAMDAMDFDNKLQFIVRPDASKEDVREAIETGYDVTIVSVNTMVTPRGQKKAIVTLAEEDDAQDVASRIGVF